MQIRDAASELVTISADPERYNDHATVFNQLTAQLRLCNKAQLSSLFKEAKGSDNSSQNKKWFVLANQYTNSVQADRVAQLKDVVSTSGDFEYNSILFGPNH